MKYRSVAAAALMVATPALAQESNDPIKLTLHDWSGQLITTTLMGEVLKEAGVATAPKVTTAPQGGDCTKSGDCTQER